MTPIRLNVLDIHQAFSLLISLGREPESNSDWITEDNDLITEHTFSSPYRTYPREEGGASAMTDTQILTSVKQYNQQR